MISVSISIPRCKANFFKFWSDEECQAQSCFSNELNDALCAKDPNQFWRTWNAKFGHKFQTQVVNGLSGHSEIAELFGILFASHSQPNNWTTHDNLQQLFQSSYGNHVGSDFDAESVINVELVESDS